MYLTARLHTVHIKYIIYLNYMYVIQLYYIYASI